MVNLLFQVFPPPKDDPHAQVALGHILAPLTSTNFNITASTIATANPLVAGFMYMKHVTEAMNKRSSELASTNPTNVRARNLDDLCKAADKRNGRGRGRYSAGALDVLVEWKTVDTAKADACGFGRLYKSAMETRIFNITRPLASHHNPVELRTLNCLEVTMKKGSTASQHD
ncbi:het-s domain-containing protein [Fusarium mundagurra]|uniref:Het-s domain-containing protein n=1 Tax=Fusarium mundagurra TaxID=1567541 RepID=A0A8H5Z8J2_9HYPO|nr:het-s domain-containing protein [Fusarium mundagurra]